MKDPIERQDAIEAICKACSMEGDYHKCDGYPETSTWCDELVALRALPSAQPETEERTAESAQNVPNDELISKKAAIDALMAWEEYSVWDEECLKHRGEPYWVAPSDVIKQLPSAQPYTDAEIQTMQDLEQAEIEKAFELGRQEGRKEAQPEQQWIPCSERLPEVNEKPYYIDPIDGNELFESEQVLVFGKNENGYDYSVASHIYSTESGDEWGNAYDSAEVELTTILAWMPLPEPYRKEGERRCEQ